MNTLRYILCGAASGYLLFAVTAGLLMDRAGVMGLLVIPAGLIGGGFVDVMPLLTETIPLAQANEAFALAADRSRAMKVQLAFT